MGGKELPRIPKKTRASHPAEHPWTAACHCIFSPMHKRCDDPHPWKSQEKGIIYPFVWESPPPPLLVCTKRPKLFPVGGLLDIPPGSRFGILWAGVGFACATRLGLGFGGFEGLGFFLGNLGRRRSLWLEPGRWGLYHLVLRLGHCGSDHDLRTTFRRPSHANLAMLQC